MDPLDRKEAVEWATRELAEILGSEAILNGKSPRDEQCEKHCEALWKLREDCPTARRFATLSGLDLTRSYSIAAVPAGKTSSYSNTGRQDTYLAYLSGLLAASNRDATSFDALFQHAVELYRHGEWPVPQLRRFKDEVDFQDRSRPMEDGRPEGVKERDYFIAIVIHEVGCLFRVLPTRNDASDHRNSACDIVADAMVALRERPNSFFHMKKIWKKRALVV